MARKTTVSGSILQLHLPERWPDGASFSAPTFHWARYDGARVERGASRLEEIAPGRQIIAVAPASRVLLARARLPQGRAARDPKVLRNAIEDSLVSGLDEIHAMPVGTLPSGESLIAVVGMAWLKSAYDELEAHLLAPSRIVIEGELLSGGPEKIWTVVRTGAGGFVHTGGLETVALDGSTESARDEVPLALNLLVHERTQAGAPPEEIVVYTSQSSLMPDTELWSKALAVKVSYAGPWQPETLDARAATRTDLVAAAGLRKSGERAAIARYRPAIYILAATIVAHLALSAIDWWHLRGEARQIQASIEDRFRRTFPDAQSVSDPGIEQTVMTRNLDALRRSSGALQSGDYIALFGRVAPQLTVAGAQARSVKYERGQLSLELSFASSESPESLQQKLGGGGVRVTVDRVSTAPSGNGTLASIRVAPEGT
jgi:type II secretion system protein L